MRRRQFSAAVFSFLLFLASCASQQAGVTLLASGASESRLDAILQAGVLRVGTTGDFTPFSYRVNSSRELRGIDIELARNLARDLGVSVRFIETAWPTLLDDLRADRFDIGMSGITITVPRRRHASFSNAVMQSGKVAIARDEIAGQFSTIAGINRSKVRVIVNPGGTNEAFARENFPLATIVVNADNVTVFDKLLAGKADVMVTDAVEAVLQEQIHPGLDVANPDEPFNQFEFGYLLPRDAAWKETVDRWLEQRRQDGTLKCLFDREIVRITADDATNSHTACD